MLRLSTLFSLLLSTALNTFNIQHPRWPDEALGSGIVRQVAGPSHDTSKKSLAAQVANIFGSEYALSSWRYFAVSSDVSWVAISKNIENQMNALSIFRAHYAKENPGIVLIDFYPQSHGAFVLAMDRRVSRSKEKLVGYYFLNSKSST